MGIIFSTNKNFSFQEEDDNEHTPDPSNQVLNVTIEKKGRGGKTVVIVSGFIGKQEDLKELSKYLKTQCGVGGAEKNGEIIIQGDVREKVMQLLQKKGYKTKRVGA